LLEVRIANGDEAHLQHTMTLAISIMEARVRVLEEIEAETNKSQSVTPFVPSSLQYALLSPAL
jgi:hypothetical protein